MIEVNITISWFAAGCITATVVWWFGFLLWKLADYVVDYDIPLPGHFNMPTPPQRIPTPEELRKMYPLAPPLKKPSGKR